MQKSGSDGADVTCCGRLFQIRTAATGKARRLRVEYEKQTAREEINDMAAAPCIEIRSLIH